MAAERALRRVVLCADDYAVHEPASRGIRALAEAGRISATSAMVLSPCWPQDARELVPLRGRIDVGLHLDFTSEFARAAGHGLPLSRAMLRAALGGFDEKTARGVIDAQLDAFEAHWGAPPDHVDGHQHVQQFAGIRDALVQALAARYPQRKPWLRISRAQGGFKDRVVSAMGAGALARLAVQADIPCSRGLSGLYDFSGDAERYAALMDGWLDRAADGALIMCHPADAAVAHDEIGAAREREFGFLSSPAFALALSRHGITLAPGRTLYLH
jgi:predicted glycoside hydrolase/deacetylase ChbG (UPF0249 family)